MSSISKASLKRTVPLPQVENYDSLASEGVLWAGSEPLMLNQVKSSLNESDP